VEETKERYMPELLLTWIVVGALAGWLASLAVRGGGIGLVGNVLVGILGGMIGGIVLNLFGGQGVTGLNAWSVGVAFFGALLLLLLLRLLAPGPGNV
jgi:uncharacterized membrane protein YeaQ/YmgE (transglycosylase-associated protein family)